MKTLLGLCRGAMIAAGVALAGCTAATVDTPAPATLAASPAMQESVLAVSPKRSTTLTRWVPAHPRGVVLFSTGYGSWPARYDKLVAALTAQGFVVLAPLHVDSVRYPDRAEFSQQQSFLERLADMRAAAAVAAREFPGLPIVAVGHSYGSLISAAEGGALAGIGPFRNPSVKAVLDFSTPGKIPGLIRPDAYAGLAVPVMVVTGTEDRIPEGLGYPNVPQDHLMPVETARAGAYGVVLDGGGHGLVDEDAMLARALPAVTLFLRAYGLDDPKARVALDRWRAAPGDRFVVRKAQP